jgi:transcriptional regulator with XRE-family HTH domain
VAPQQSTPGRPEDQVEDFRQMLRRFREQRGWSQKHLARVSGVDNSHLARIERGERDCSADVAQWLDTALGADGDLLASHQTTNTETHARGDAEAVKRRTIILGTLTGLALGGASPAVALEAVGHGLSVGADTDADDWAGIAVEYGLDYYTTPPEYMIERLGADLTVLQHQLVPQPDNRDLLRVAGQLAVVMAMTLTASGQLGWARRWWRRARRHGDKSCDVDTQVLVRAWEVTSGGYEGRNPDPLVLLADEAVALGGHRATAAVAGLHAGRAQALALSGRHDEAVDAVRQVEQVTNQIPASVAAESESLWGWPEHRAVHTASYVYTEAGRYQEAAEAQARADDVYPARMGRLRTQVGLHEAMCLIRQRDIPGGLRHAADLLDALPPDQHNAILYAVGHRLMSHVPAIERGRPEADEVRQRLVAPAI